MWLGDARDELPSSTEVTARQLAQRACRSRGGTLAVLGIASGWSSGAPRAVDWSTMPRNSVGDEGAKRIEAKKKRKS